MSIPKTAVIRFNSNCIVLLVSAIFAVASFMLTRSAIATDVCSAKAALVVSVQGDVELRRAQTTLWEPAKLDTPLCAGDSLRVRNHSRAAIRLNNDSLMRLDQRSTITIPQTEDNRITSFIDLIEGAIHVITRTPKPFKIRTPFLNAGVEGTEFFVGVKNDHTQVVIFEGRVSAENALGNLLLTDHEAAIAYHNQPPQKETVIKPFDAVQWALYYPAIIGYHRDRLDTTETDFTNQLHEAEQLLSVGQAEEASSIIGSILDADPNNSAAIALQSIIAVIQNDKQTALELAKRAVEYEELSVAARLALSYAQQASFDIEAASASVKQAVILDPQNALIWARLAELQMSAGELKQAFASAQEAVDLNPTIAKTQTVLGFAYLLQIDTAEAKSVFHDAILLDQADPMPRLGLGLALIREGQLEAGRIELEIAASLHPGNSLIRSYLGKAYFEEKRYSTAETQFELAKERDPNDPTPWFYDAIQKQTQNRPVEALRDIQKSIELNDNRAVYRSRLLLDQDQAGRGSSLARIYDNLGFERRALMETAKSLAYDPSNHSAHRFLSDTYANIPRHEVARVSELLQAQLLQPINVNPVQPHAAVPDLNIITNTGPLSTGFNEFAPLMERNRPQLVASGVAGNEGTLGNEMVFSQLYGRTSASLGQFHYETNGFRPNNSQKHNIYNAFIQHAFTPKLNLQAEIRTRESSYGDILLDFNPNFFSQKEFFKFKKDTVRTGAKYTLTSNQDLIISAAYINWKRHSATQNFGQELINSQNEAQAYQVETQYHYRKDFLNFIAGGGTYEIWSNNLIQFGKNNEQSTNAYLYTHISLPYDLTTTIGVSYNTYKNYKLRNNITETDPKIGIQWSILQNLRLRLAWFETVRSSLITQQTLEPTQIAGFNQLYDDPIGSKTRKKGIGLDARIFDNFYGGFEGSVRRLKVPILGLPSETQKELLYRAYFYGLLSPKWSISGEIQFEKFTRKENINNGLEPNKIQTLNTPISLNYFNQNGVFLKLTGTFVNQNLTRLSKQKNIDELRRSGEYPNNLKIEGNSNFFLLDASIGYRLPKRRGLINFEGKNLLNNSFFFRNPQFYVSEPTLPLYSPARTLFVQLTLNF